MIVNELCAVTDVSNSKTNVKKTRNVTIDTIEKKWKSKLASKDVNIWFSYRKEGNHAVDIKSTVCTKFEHLIKDMKGLSKSWITGSQHYKLSNAQDHADAEPHKMSMWNYYKQENKVREDKRDANQLTLDASFLAGDVRTNEQMSLFCCQRRDGI